MRAPGTAVDHLYTHPVEAAMTLHQRRLCSKLTASNPLEELLRSQPCAVLFRQVATPNLELQRFATLAKSVGLKPLVLEYHDDKFVHFNTAKHALMKMRFHSGTGRKGGSRVRCLSVGDMNGCDGKALRELYTHSGQKIVEYHCALTGAAAFSQGVLRYEGSWWFRHNGGVAGSYYPELFRLFSRHAVMFESFLSTGSDAAFTANVILPSFDAVACERGEFPLVCRLDPAESEGDPYWLHYPGELFDAAQSLLSSASPSWPSSDLDRLSLKSDCR